MKIETDVNRMDNSSGPPYECDDCGYEFNGSERVYQVFVYEQLGEGAGSIRRIQRNFIETAGWYCEDCVENNKTSKETEQIEKRYKKKKIVDEL